jgi:hypothetical protein
MAVGVAVFAAPMAAAGPAGVDNEVAYLQQVNATNGMTLDQEHVTLALKLGYLLCESDRAGLPAPAGSEDYQAAARVNLCGSAGPSMIDIQQGIQDTNNAHIDAWNDNDQDDDQVGNGNDDFDFDDDYH